MNIYVCNLFMTNHIYHVIVFIVYPDVLDLNVFQESSVCRPIQDKPMSFSLDLSYVFKPPAKNNADVNEIISSLFVSSLLQDARS